MQTRSNIQLIRESIEAITQYKESLEGLMDKYTIEDSVFICIRGKVYEATQGYFTKTSTHQDLQEAIKACQGDYRGNGIRIINNETFEVGELKKYLSECKRDADVYDINHMSAVKLY